MTHVDIPQDGCKRADIIGSATRVQLTRIESSHLCVFDLKLQEDWGGKANSYVISRSISQVPCFDRL